MLVCIRSWSDLGSLFLLVLLTGLVCQICVTSLRSRLHQRSRLPVELFDIYFCRKGILSPTMEIEVLGA